MGRPRKYPLKESATPQKVTVAKTKSVKSVETLEKQVEELTELLTSSIEAQLESYQVSVDAEDKFRELASETEKCLNMIAYHCHQVQENTGSLTAEDVEYSISLTKRIIEHKFKKA